MCCPVPKPGEIWVEISGWPIAVRKLGLLESRLAIQHYASGRHKALFVLAAGGVQAAIMPCWTWTG